MTGAPYTTVTRYRISVRNRFEALCHDGETVTETYDHFIKANEAAAMQYIPKKKSSKKTHITSDHRVVQARSNVEIAFSTFQKSTTTENQEILQDKKAKLQDAYDEATEEELSKLIQKVETADERARHGESWRLINQLTGRKTAKKGILKGRNKDERIRKWYTHFKELLGKESDVDDDVYKIHTIVGELNILEEPFTRDEYTAVKKKLVEGKSSGPDGIAPEILKRCDFDDIILSYGISFCRMGKNPNSGLSAT